MMRTRLFMGTRVTPELKNYAEKLADAGLQLIPFEGREYIGYYLKEEYPTLCQLRTHHKFFTEQMQKNLPDVRLDTFPILFFPQVLIG